MPNHGEDKVQNGYGAHLAFYSMCMWFLSGNKAARAWCCPLIPV